MNQLKPKPMFNKKEEKRNQIILALVCAFVLFLAFITQGQIDRMKNYNPILKRESVTKYPHDPITFESPKSHTDTLFLSIQADSVGNDVYGITLYAYFPGNIDANNSSVYIGFDDGTYERFGLISYDKQLGYSEYEITEKTLACLRRKRYNYVAFENIAQCYVRGKKDYFMNFLAAYDK